MTIRLSKRQFYVPSGCARPVDLFGLALAVFCIVFILNFTDALLWTNSLLPDIFAFFLTFVWLVLLFILAKVATKILRIRCPGLAFFISFAVGVGGYLSAWWLIAVLHSSTLSLFKFICTFVVYGKIFERFWNSEIFIATATMTVYALAAAAGVSAQSSLPFNEEQNRWFKKLSLPLISIRSKGANKAMSNIVRGNLGDFVRTDDYSIVHTYNIFLGCLKFDIHYDQERPECYITVNEYQLSVVNVVHTVVRNLLVSKRLAYAIQNKIMSGIC